MTLVGVQKIEKLYGGRRILDGLEWTIEEERRIGLVGPNGHGKSTLLRILAGTEDVQSGEVTRKRGLRVAYLPQHVEGDERTPLQTVMAGREDLVDLEREIAAVEASLSSPEVYSDFRKMERVLAQQEKLLRRFEEAGGSGVEGEARRHLLELGLNELDFSRPTRDLSGGQRKLVALAACLAQRPELLLLDEPETHLDLPRRQHLEGLIRSFSGTVVIVSHDRYLLDETVGEIAELENGKLRLWPGNYSAYAVAKELEVQRQQMLYVSQQKEIARLEEAIKRFELWASMVVNERHIKQARVKQRQIDQMDKVERPVLERRKMKLQLRSQLRGGQKVVDLRKVTAGYDGAPVLSRVDLTVWRGERVGVIGPNGIGKSVLAKTLVGELQPWDGEVWVGPSIRLGYFAQGHETLPAESTPLSLVRSVRSGTEDAAVAQLMKFLFTYEQVRQPVRTLSGGERSRLQLLLLMLGGANCLILDEPTNHLDIDSAEVLEGALEEYDGTALIISHDRYFLDRIADRIVEVRAKQLFSFEGGYSAWNEAQQKAAV